MIRCGSAGLTGGALFAAEFEGRIGSAAALSFLICGRIEEVKRGTAHGRSSVFFQLRPYR